MKPIYGPEVAADKKPPRNRGGVVRSDRFGPQGGAGCDTPSNPARRFRLRWGDSFAWCVSLFLESREQAEHRSEGGCGSSSDVPYLALPLRSPHFGEAMDKGLHLFPRRGLTGLRYYLAAIRAGQRGKAAHGLLIFGQRHH